MPDSIPTSVTAERFDAYAKRGNATQARERKFDLAAALDSTVRALRDLKDAGIDKASLFDAANLLRDAISNADHACNLDIDDAGQSFDDIDLSELDELRGRLA